MGLPTADGRYSRCTLAVFKIVKQPVSAGQFIFSIRPSDVGIPPICTGVRTARTTLLKVSKSRVLED